MNEKKKCPNCGLLIDSDMEKCPYCGFIIQQGNKVVSEVKEEPKEVISEKPEKKRWIKFAERKDVNKKKEVSLFLFMVLGLQILSLAFSLVSQIINPYFLYSQNGQAMMNFSLYFVALGVCLLIINKDVINIFYKFKNARTYLYGISYGFLLILASALYNVISNFLFGNVGSNNNENTINQIVVNFPILSVIVFSFIGPICEEFGYRLGLFSFLRKYNRVIAYIVSAVIFGFIHFDFSSFGNPDALKVELINIPSYVISGLILCYVYDKEGLETSILCHVTNNFIGVMMTIISTIA